ncbi:MAG TPA: VOC family protein [Candidatus Limnocylindrales bacterium]|jgi:catechol 2,3-dioxygenase-like lactoylglutathione lyase family enzyme
MLDQADFICPVPVRDLARARAFYTQVLGLAPVAESEAGILVTAGGARILLYTSAAGAAPSHTLAGWEVPKLEPVIAALQARGVRFEDYDFPGLRTEDHIAWIGPERAAWFRDSEGNVLAISEPWIDRPG